MNELLLAMVFGSKGMDKARLGDYLRSERARKEKDYAKVARGVVFFAYWWTGSLKMNVTNASGQTVPATDPSVSTTAKLDALLSGTAEVWKAIPYFGLLSEAATFIGEVIARSTTMDPALLELMMNNGTTSQPQTITLQAPPARGNYAQPQTLRLTAPGGSSTGMRITAQGIEIEDPNWRVSVD